MNHSFCFRNRQLAAILFLVCATACSKKELVPSEPPSSTQVDAHPGKHYFEHLNISTFAGSNVFGYSGDGGPVSMALFNSPQNVYVDRKGNAYITDLGNLVIRKVDAKTHIVHTIAGNGLVGFSGDGGPATSASLNYAFHIIADEQENLYISDLGNNRIRKIDHRTGIIQTIAGTGIADFNGDGHLALETNLNIPFGMAFDKAGNIIFSDNAGLRLRKLNVKTNIITTIAGGNDRGYAGDGGPASYAMFNFIWNVTTDERNGDIYLSDQFNYRIRKIDAATGKISTVAGNGLMGNIANASQATSASFTEPVGIAVDRESNLFITDQVLSQVYRVDSHSGAISLIAGNGTNGFAGDGGPAANALLSHPNSLFFDPSGDLYVNDANNNRVRIISNAAQN